MESIKDFIVGEPTDYPAIAKQHVRNYLEQVHRKNYPMTTIPEFEVYVIWFAKILQNWKAILGCTLPNGRIYEVTYDGDKKTTYFDDYGKLSNFAIPDEE